MRKGLFAEDEYETERDMTWSELFFDLIFVVAIARLGEHLREADESKIGFGYYCLYFTIIWFFWDRAANYSTHAVGKWESDLKRFRVPSSECRWLANSTIGALIVSGTAAQLWNCSNSNRVERLSAKTS